MADSNNPLANMIDNIINEYNRALRKGTLDIEGAIKMLLRQSEAIERMEDFNTLSRIYITIGIYEGTRSNFEESINYFMKSAEASRVDNNLTRFASNYANIAETYRLLNDVQSASEYFHLSDEAVEPLEMQEKWNLLMQNHCNEGQLWLTNSNYKKAESLLQQALGIANEYRDYDTRRYHNFAPEIHSSLARVYALTENAAKADTHLDEAFRFLRQQENTQLLGHAYHSKAILALAKRADLDEITANLEECLVAYQKVDFRFGIADALLFYGNVLAVYDDLAGAKIKWREAGKLFEELNLHQWAEKAYAKLN